MIGSSVKSREVSEGGHNAFQLLGTTMKITLNCSKDNSHCSLHSDKIHQPEIQPVHLLAFDLCWVGHICPWKAHL